MFWDIGLLLFIFFRMIEKIFIIIKNKSNIAVPIANGSPKAKLKGLRK